MTDLPQFQSNGMSTSSVSVGNLNIQHTGNTSGGKEFSFTSVGSTPGTGTFRHHGSDLGNQTLNAEQIANLYQSSGLPTPQGSPTVTQPISVALKPGTLRILRVFLVDPDERLPVDKRIIYRSEELTTDATDAELYYEIENLKQLVAAHNDVRKKVKWEEKTDSGTKTHTGLKDVRLRDLIFSTTLIAAFASK